MAYANGRTYFDADSHLMERPNFLRDYAAAGVRDRLAPLNGGVQDKVGDEFQDIVSRQGHTPERVRDMMDLGDGLISGPKGYKALGAFNADERTQALNQLGFAKQLVFSTFSPSQALHGTDVELKYAAARAHNRAMSDFCKADNRLLGVGLLPLDVPALALSEVENLVSADLRAAWVGHHHFGGRSPGHSDYDLLWAKLADAGIPVVLHVGGTPIQLNPAWMNTGRPVPTDWLGGGENVRGKDMLALHHGAELFLGAMIFDGVFERHRNLKAAAVELGAGWVPSWLNRMDWTANIWRKEYDLASLSRQPSEIVAEQVGFTPYVYEDVGRLIAESDDNLYLFSSDYPHFEGSKNPIERFEQSLDVSTLGDSTRDRFYESNFSRLFL